MVTMKNPFLLLFSIMLFYSCTEKKQENSQDQLMQSVMAVHDEVMPKMSDIMKYKKQIGEKIQELRAAGEDANKDMITRLEEVSNDLDTSHKEMMDWMHGFNPQFEGMKEEDVVKYLNDEKAKIEQVGQQVEATLKEALEALQ